MKKIVYDRFKMAQHLKAAEADPAISGFVFSNDETRHRHPIFHGSELVGFATPRQDHDLVWRMGAIWVHPDFRNRGLAKQTLTEFMNQKRGRAFIENGNLASTKLYESCGFRQVQIDPQTNGSWWENF